MTILEYVMLLALVAMIAFGTLVYLGRGSGSPAHVANNVGDAAVGGLGEVVGNNAALDGPGSPFGGTAIGTPVKAWCTSGESGCTDPMAINGQMEVIYFQVTGGTAPYTYQLQGSVPSFIVPDWTANPPQITVQPTDCSQDLGTYNVSLVVTDAVGDTGQLSFTLNVATGSLCSG